MNLPWSEVQSLATHAAAGAGVPSAQALAFGAMVVRHLADRGAQGPLCDILQTPERITALFRHVETVIELASVKAKPIKLVEPDPEQRALLTSWIAALPCRSVVDVSGETVLAALDLSAPSTAERVDMLVLEPQLADSFQRFAAQTEVPGSLAARAVAVGAGLMQTE